MSPGFQLIHEMLFLALLPLRHTQPDMWRLDTFRTVMIFLIARDLGGAIAIQHIVFFCHLPAASFPNIRIMASLS